MDRETVLELAAMARLKLSADEVERARGQLGAVLAHFEVLQGVDTAGCEASPYPRTIALRTRPDEPAPPLPRDEVLANAPARAAGQFVVPKVVDA